MLLVRRARTLSAREPVLAEHALSKDPDNDQLATPDWYASLAVYIPYPWVSLFLVYLRSAHLYITLTRHSLDTLGHDVFSTVAA